MFGRAGELGIVERFLDGMVSGLSMLMIEGRPGIGKTTLWQAGIERAAARCYMVLSCRPAQSEAALSLAGLADLLAEVDDDVLARLPMPQRRALDVALLRCDTLDPPRDPRALATAVRNVMVELAGRAPLLIAIDDLQWLDVASAGALEFAVRRLGNALVGFLAVVREAAEPNAPLASFAAEPNAPRGDRVRLRRAFAQDRVMRLRVGPLSVGALHHVLRANLGEALPRPVLVRVAQAVGGNPFFALELARVLLERGIPEPGQPLPVPGDVEQLVAGRARGLSVRARAALLTAAALPQARVQMVEQVLGRPSAADLASAQRAGMVELDRGLVRFTHPLFATAVYASASPERRRRLHRRLAEVIDDAEQRAHHLALATEGPDERVATIVEQAVRSVARRGAATTAAELAEHARALTPSQETERIRDRGILAAEYHLCAGDLPRARALLEEVVAAAVPGAARAYALMLLGQVRYHQDSFPHARRLLEQAFTESQGDSGFVALIEGQLGYVLANTGDLPGAAGHIARARSLLEEHGSPEVLAETLALGALVDVMLGHALDEAKLERALALEDVDRLVVGVARPSLLAGICLLFAGRVADARVRLRAFRERVLERGQEGDLLAADIYLAWIACLRGDLAAARGYAHEAHEAAVELGSDSIRGLTLAMCALVDAHSGDVAAVRDGAVRDGAVRDGAEQALVLLRRAGWTVEEPWALWARGFLELSLGNPAGTDQALEPLAKLVESAGEVVMPISAILPDEIEALVRLGELERAERLLTMLEAGGRRSGLAWTLAGAARCRALLLAARDDTDAALAALDEALAWHARLEMPLELARTLLVRGMIERRCRRKRAAQGSLAQALDLFERSGATLWAQRTREESERVGLRPSAPQDLTASEQRVAELVSQGLTNREVAAAAFMSEKTVEANLSRIYRKLAIRSRSELGARLTGRGDMRRS